MTIFICFWVWFSQKRENEWPENLSAYINLGIKAKSHCLYFHLGIEFKFFFLLLYQELGLYFISSFFNFQKYILFQRWKSKGAKQLIYFFARVILCAEHEKNFYFKPSRILRENLREKFKIDKNLKLQKITLFKCSLIWEWYSLWIDIIFNLGL